MMVFLNTAPIVPVLWVEQFRVCESVWVSRVMVRVSSISRVGLVFVLVFLVLLL